MTKGGHIRLQLDGPRAGLIKMDTAESAGASSAAPTTAARSPAAKPARAEEALQALNVTIANIDIPADNDGSYSFCGAVKLENLGQEKMHIVRIEPAASAPGRDPYVQAMAIFECRSDEEASEPALSAEDARWQGPCASEDYPASLRKCMARRPYFSWSQGDEAFELPAEAGFPLQPDAEGSSYFVLAILLDVPSEGKATMKKETGFILQASPELRKHDAGFLMTGFNTSGIDPARASAIDYLEAVCPTDCTSGLPKEGVNIFAATMHLGDLGNMGFSGIVREGVLTPIIHEEDYSMETAGTKTLDTPMKLMPGDSIVTACEFKQAAAEEEESQPGYKQPMCFAAFAYYPAQTELAACISSADESASTMQTFSTQSQLQSAAPPIFPQTAMCIAEDQKEAPEMVTVPGPLDVRMADDAAMAQQEPVQQEQWQWQQQEEVRAYPSSGVYVDAQGQQYYYMDDAAAEAGVEGEEEMMDVAGYYDYVYESGRGRNDDDDDDDDYDDDDDRRSARARCKPVDIPADSVRSGIGSVATLETGTFNGTDYPYSAWLDEEQTVKLFWKCISRAGGEASAGAERIMPASRSMRGVSTSLVSDDAALMEIGRGLSLLQTSMQRSQPDQEKPVISDRLMNAYNSLMAESGVGDAPTSEELLLALEDRYNFKLEGAYRPLVLRALNYVIDAFMQGFEFEWDLSKKLDLELEFEGEGDVDGEDIIPGTFELIDKLKALYGRAASTMEMLKKEWEVAVAETGDASLGAEKLLSSMESRFNSELPADVRPLALAMMESAIENYRAERAAAAASAASAEEYAAEAGVGDDDDLVPPADMPDRPRYDASSRVAATGDQSPCEAYRFAIAFKMPGWTLLGFPEEEKISKRMRLLGPDEKITIESIEDLLDDTDVALGWVDGDGVNLIDMEVEVDDEYGGYFDVDDSQDLFDVRGFNATLDDLGMESTFAPSEEEMAETMPADRKTEEMPMSEEDETKRVLGEEAVIIEDEMAPRDHVPGHEHEPGEEPHGHDVPEQPAAPVTGGASIAAAPLALTGAVVFSAAIVLV